MTKDILKIISEGTQKDLKQLMSFSRDWKTVDRKLLIRMLEFAVSPPRRGRRKLSEEELLMMPIACLVASRQLNISYTKYWAMHFNSKAPKKPDKTIDEAISMLGTKGMPWEVHRDRACRYFGISFKKGKKTPLIKSG